MADALDSGSSELTLVQVQVLFPAPNTLIYDKGVFLCAKMGKTMYVRERLCHNEGNMRREVE